MVASCTHIKYYLSFHAMVVQLDARCLLLVCHAFDMSWWFQVYGMFCRFGGADSEALGGLR